MLHRKPDIHKHARACVWCLCVSVLFEIRLVILIHLNTYYKTKLPTAFVCMFPVHSKTTKHVIIRFSLIDRVIHEEV